MRTSEVLNLAADLIRERGWVKGPSGWDRAGGLCLEGGIIAAAGIKGGILANTLITQCPAFQAVSAYLEPQVRAYHEAQGWPTHELHPFTYNDSIAKDAEDVIGVLRACAVIEESREKVAYATITLESQNQLVSA